MISEWNDLQTILAIAAAGTLSGAARSLGVNQSTVSRRLQAIETGLNRPVFTRTADGRLEPNEAGGRLIEAAQRVRETVAEANSDLRTIPAPVRLASCEVLSKEYAAPALAAWSVETGLPSDLTIYSTLFEMPEDSFDIIITPLESAPEDMVGRRIGDLRWGLYATPDYLADQPLDPKATSLSGHRVVHPSGTLVDIAACKWFCALGGTAVFSSSSTLTQRDVAETGTGIAFLPSSIVPAGSPLLRLETVLDLPVTEIWMVARRAVMAQPRVAAFLRWSNSHFRSTETPLKRVG